MRTGGAGSWRVTQKGASVAILRPDASIVAELPVGGSPQTKIAEAYAIAAAPELLDMCNRVKSMLENNLLVTAEGFKIDCSELRENLLSTILRARGCRRSQGEP